MTTSFGVVCRWRSAPLAAAGSVSSAVGDRLDQSVLRLTGSRQAVGGAGDALLGSTLWSGVAAEAASARLDEAVLRLARLAAAVAAVDDAVRLAASRVASAELLAQHAQTCAAGAGGLLGDDGRLVAALPTAVVGAGPDPLDLAETLAARAVAEAALADDALAAALRALEPVVASTGASGPPFATTAHTGPWSAAVALPLASGGAAPTATVERGDAAVRDAALAWWCALTPAARVDAVTAEADRVGSTDGIPAWARDRANRQRLVRAQQDLAREAARLRPVPPERGVLSTVAPPLAPAGVLPAVTVADAAYRRVMAQQTALHAVEQVLAAPDGHRRQLLVLDLSGPSVRAAVAVGDVDAAQHLAVVVPGFTTTVAGDLVGSDRVAADLADLARREALGWGDRGDVAVVSWLGYDAPQAADTFRSTSVVRRVSAEAGADTLAPFLRGLPPAAHLTLVAHSYGSTTAGLAMARGDTGVDDLVAIGSPGLGVGSTTALGLPATRIHVLEASDDPVADLGWFGPDPSSLPGVDRPATTPSVLPDGSPGSASVGHSAYLSPGTTSQWNVAAVVAGLPARAGRRPPAVTSW